jgi:hypothetical protein
MLFAQRREPESIVETEEEKRDICTKRLQSTVKKLYMGSISKTGAETDTKKHQTNGRKEATRHEKSDN